MLNYLKVSLLLLLLMIGLNSLISQSINIGIIYDEVSDSDLEIEYEGNLKEEIFQLLHHRYEIQFNSYFGSKEGTDYNTAFTEAYLKNDVVIALGNLSSNYAITRNDFPKPTISAIVLDSELQGLIKTENGTSGINNFTYTESPFDIERDLNILYEIYPFDHLEVITEEGTIGEVSFMKQLFANYLKGKDVTVDHIYYKTQIADHFNDMEGAKVAVYALPYLGSDENLVQSIFQTINDNKVPSAALFGEEYIQNGALAAYETGGNLQKIPRRIALSLMKILEGQNAADLSVEMRSFGENLMINMETARQIGVYPNFDIMNSATLINLENIQTDNKINLQQALGIALNKNLSIKIEEADIQIADTETSIAKSELLPQVDVSSTFLVKDEISTLASQGAQGRANWIFSGNLSQIIFAEPALANVAIQKLLKKNEESQYYQTQLDVVIDVATAYMNILFAKSNLNIQQQNVERNKDNFDISKTKQAIGHLGVTDINRWEAELANSNISLNDAYASLRQAKFRLNQLLNHPINEAIEIEEATLLSTSLLITDGRIAFIDDYGALNKFSDFLVDFALDNLPELTQVDLGLEIEKRLQLSRERAMYLPTLGLSGSSNRIATRINIPDGLPERDNSTTWEIALGLKYPIFQGNNRKKLIEQSKLNIDQLKNTRKNVENQLELLIRSNLENVGASFSRMELSQKAADASRKNYEIVQDAYSAGQTNITNLIDAQNNALATDLNSTNAIFTFILDFLNLERSIGVFSFLSTQEEKDDFFTRAQTYLK